MYDVLIIGGGIVGTTIARRLSRYKLSVCLVEKSNDVAMGSTKANSAIVHGGYAEANAKLKGRLCYKGRVQYEQLDKELNFGFRKTGSLVTMRSWPWNRTLIRTCVTPCTARAPESVPRMRWLSPWRKMLFITA